MLWIAQKWKKVAYKIDFMCGEGILMIETSNSDWLLGKDGAGDKGAQAKQTFIARFI